MHNACIDHEVIYALKYIFREHGIPECIIRDNGHQNNNYAFKQFAKDWEFDYITSSPKYAQSNGFVGRTIQMIKNTIKKG